MPQPVSSTEIMTKSVDSGDCEAITEMVPFSVYLIALLTRLIRTYLILSWSLVITCGKFGSTTRER